MVDGVNKPEDNIVRCDSAGQLRATSSGSESTACSHREQVNVGGPERSATDQQYRRTSPAGEDVETVFRKSDGSYY